MKDTVIVICAINLIIYAILDAIGILSFPTACIAALICYIGILYTC